MCSSDLDAVIKVFCEENLNEEDLKDLQNNLTVTTNLSHPNIVVCFSISASNRNASIAMEYLPLGDLSQLIIQAGDEPSLLSIELIIRICIDVADAMQYIHSLSLEHKGLTSSNVLLSHTQVSNPLPCAKVSDILTAKSALSVPVGSQSENADIYAFGICK